MTGPMLLLLDAVNIDPNRQYIEFQFRDVDGQGQIVQIDFDYLEPLAGVLRQAYTSAVMERQHGGNREVGEDFIPVPRVDVDQPVRVGIDMMTGNIVTMLLPRSPFQSCFSMPVAIARALARDILSACEAARNGLAGRRPS